MFLAVIGVTQSRVSLLLVSYYDMFVLQTEDQILLLQNSWAELVSLGAIWRSRFSHGIIQLSFGKTIDIKKAREMKHEEVSEMGDG